MISITHSRVQAPISGPSSADSWVHEALEPDQFSKAKRIFGRLKISRKTMVLLWGLRVYVAFMILLVAFQIFNALHAKAG